MKTQFEISVPGKLFRCLTPYVGIHKALLYLNSSNVVYAANSDDMRDLYTKLKDGEAVVRVNHGFEILIREVKPVKFMLDVRVKKPEKIFAKCS